MIIEKWRKGRKKKKIRFLFFFLTVKMSTHPDLFHQLQLELEQRELVSLSQVAIATKKEQKETDCHPIG